MNFLEEISCPLLNIVNVSSDVNSTVHSLPRPLSESQTIPIIKLGKGVSVISIIISCLVDTSDFFKGEGVVVQNRWLNDINATNNKDWREFVQNPSVLNPIDKSNNSIFNTGVDSQDEVDNNDWCEVEESPSGVTDTLLQESNIVENADRIISFAPGEGNKPLGIFLDKDSDYHSFPSIFCGKRRPGNNDRKVIVQYKSEVGIKKSG